MIDRFTDHARLAVRTAFGRLPAVPERDVVAALAEVRRGVAHRMLSRVGVSQFDLWSGPPFVEWRELAAGAVQEARRRGVDYVGTEHLLLALARMPESGLPGVGASGDKLDEALTAIEAERARRPTPWVARRLGRWCRAALRWIGGRR